jgi:hypothetical protein
MARLRSYSDVARTAAVLVVVFALVFGYLWLHRSRRTETATQPSTRSSPTVPMLAPTAAEPFEIVDVTSWAAVDAAINRYVVSCARARGVDVGALPPSFPANLLLASFRNVGPRTEQDVRRRGLHAGPLASAPISKLVGNASVVAADCQERARGRLNAKTFDDLNSRFDDLTNEMSGELSVPLTPILDANERAEHRCVAQSGWKPALPGRIDDPDISPAELFGIPVAADVVDPKTGTETYVPLPREIDLALALFRCQQRLHSDDTTLDRAKEFEAPIVARHELVIRQLNSDMQAMARTAARILG